MIKMKLPHAKRILGVVFHYYHDLPKNEELLRSFYGLETKDVVALHELCLMMEMAIDRYENQEA